MTKSYKRKWLHKGGIIRQRGNGFQVEINFNSKRIRETLDSLVEAKSRIDQLNTELKNKGLDSLALTPDQRMDAAMAIKILPANTSLHDAIRVYVAAVSKLEGEPLGDAVDFYLRHHKPVGGVKTVSELLIDYIAAKDRLGRRACTLKDIRCRMNRFAEDFGSLHVHTIISEDIEKWMDGKDYKGQSRINYCRVLSGFFSYARKLGLIEVNPADRDHIDRPRMDEHLPVIFPVAAVEQLMSAALSRFPNITPYLALGFFAGLRTSELDGLDWENINIEQKLITVRPEIAKRRRQRHVDMSDNLVAWLQRHNRTKGAVRVKGFRRSLRLLVKECKVDWIHNGMRHTYASNHLAKHQDFSKTALQLGHVGRPDVLVNHYRNLVTPSDCERYWKIVPATPSS